jgi:hypothetical protein
MLNMSSLNKVFIEFETCFWPKDTHVFGTFGTKKGRDLVGIINYIHYSGKNILLIF